MTLAPIALAFALAGCLDGFMTVDGRITRCADGQPLVGVKIVMTASHETATTYTDPDGTYSAAVNEPPTTSATLVLEKPGYATQEHAFAQSETRQDYCLMP